MIAITDAYGVLLRAGCVERPEGLGLLAFGEVVVEVEACPDLHAGRWKLLPDGNTEYIGPHEPVATVPVAMLTELEKQAHTGLKADLQAAALAVVDAAKIATAKAVDVEVVSVR